MSKHLNVMRYFPIGPSFFILAIGPSILMAITLLVVVHHALASTIDNFGERRAESLAGFVGVFGRSAIEENDIEELRVIVGKVLGENDVIEVGIRSFLNESTKVQASKEGQYEKAWFSSIIPSASILNVSHTVILASNKDAKETKIGAFTITFNRSIWFSNLSDSVNYFWVSVLLSLVFIMVLAFFFANDTSRAFSEIVRTIERIAGGDYSKMTLNNYSGDLGIVEECIQKMAVSLGKSKSQHEKEVLAATSKYQEKNSELEDALEHLEVKNKELEGTKLVIDKKNEALIGVNRDLMEATQVAESASDAKTEFIANISHEIKTPMHAIKGFSSLLVSTDLSSDQLESVSSIQLSCAKLEKLIGELLDLSKIEGGKYVAKNERFDLVSEIDSMLNSHKTEATKKLIYIDYIHEPSAPVSVYGDRNALARILGNVLSNAVKFTENGGVVINVSSESMSLDTCNVIFEITDSGAGIAEEDTSIIFDSFEQADSSLTRKYQGTGLGLSIAKKFTGLLGGSIGVSSALGEGSKFTCVIPLKIDGMISSKQSAFVRDYGSPHKMPSVLIVDDRDSFIKSIQFKLMYVGIDSETYSLKEAKGIESKHEVLLVRDANRNLGLISEVREKAEVKHCITLESECSEESLYEMEAREVVDAALPVLCDKGRLYQYVYSLSKSYSGRAADKDSIDKDGLSEALRIIKESPLPLDGISILNVDDKHLNLRLNRVTLEQLGATVVDAENGKKAVSLAASRKFGVILMDYMMPIMNGEEAAAAIKEGGLSSDSPIIGLTAAELNDTHRGFSELMTCVYKKPFSHHQIMGAISSLQVEGKIPANIFKH